MNYLEQYQQILEALKRGERPWIRPSQEQYQDLYRDLSQLLDSLQSGSNGHKNIQKIEQDLLPFLCILGHTQTTSELFEDILIQMLKEEDLNPQIQIYVLAAAHVHILKRRKLEGLRAPLAFLEALKKAIYAQDAEVALHALLTVEELGSQGIFLREDILRAKPNFFSRLNKHRNSCYQIIEELQKKWDEWSVK